MLSHLDFIIFPDRCEVLEIVPSQRYFYPIFKNGSTSLLKKTLTDKSKIYLNEQIKRIAVIDVVIRDPQERFVSGISSFVLQVTKENPALDKNTVLWFAKNYLHLNRHYCMQFSWLVNLARYLSPETKLNLLSMQELEQFTKFNDNPWNAKDEFDHKELITPNQEMYNRVDQVLFDAIGQSLTFSEIVELIQQQDPDAYQQVILRAQKILNPTYVVSQT